MQDSPKLDVVCATRSVKVYGSFFFAEPTVTGISYLDMLENYLMPQLQQDMDRDVIFQQDEAPLHFHCKVTSYLNCTVVAWIGQHDCLLTPLDFSVWGYIKDQVFVLPLPASLEELQAWITAVVETTDANVIHRIRDKIAYRCDICRVTRGNHIEHL